MSWGGGEVGVNFWTFIGGGFTKIEQMRTKERRGPNFGHFVRTEQLNFPYEINSALKLVFEEAFNIRFNTSNDNKVMSN